MWYIIESEVRNMSWLLVGQILTVFVSVTAILGVLVGILKWISSSEFKAVNENIDAVNKKVSATNDRISATNDRIDNLKDFLSNKIDNLNLNSKKN